MDNNDKLSKNPVPHTNMKPNLSLFQTFAVALFDDIQNEEQVDTKILNEETESTEFFEAKWSVWSAHGAWDVWSAHGRWGVWSDHGNHGNHGNHSNWDDWNDWADHSNSAPPEVTVKNSNEFLQLEFSTTGRLDGSNFEKYSPNLYDSNYDDAHNKYEGIFVVVDMKDTNTGGRWQKGTASIKDTNLNTTISSTDIYWSDSPYDAGSTIVQSGGDTKRGYAFFSKRGFSNLVVDNAVIEITVTEYSDPDCTNPTGVSTTTTTVSSE